MKKWFGVLTLIFLISFCYCEGIAGEDRENTKSKKYILSPNIGYEYYNASIGDRGIRIDTGVIGLDFMYLDSSGFTVYADIGIVFGTSLYYRAMYNAGYLYAYLPFREWTSGGSLELFFGYSWEFQNRHIVSLAGGVQSTLAPVFSSYGLAVRVNYSFAITEKIGIMSVITGAISYNTQLHGLKTPHRSIGIGRFALKVGPYFNL